MRLCHHILSEICAERSLASGIVQGLECSSSSADSMVVDGSCGAMVRVLLFVGGKFISVM